MTRIRGPLVALLIAFTTSAVAHEAGPLMPPGQTAQVVPSVSPPAGKQPTGWKYPWACCSGMDCAEVKQTDVHETPGGYTVDGATDESPIPYGNKRIKDSPDGAFHWCAHRSGPDIGKTICLFVPPKGF